MGFRSPSNMNTALIEDEKKKQERKEAETGGDTKTPPGSTSVNTSTQAPKKTNPKNSKGASSGMFTNVQKYIERNEPGSQRMGQSVQDNVAQQNQNVQQAINKQKTDFMSRVQDNRARIGAAQEFGQEVVDNASNAVNMHQAQDTIKEIQNRINSFQWEGNVDPYDLGKTYDYYLKNWQPPQPEDNSAYSNEQLQYGLEDPLKFKDFVAHEAYNTYQNMYQDANTKYTQSRDSLTDLLSDNRIDRLEPVPEGSRKPDYYDVSDMRRMSRSGYDDDFLNAASNQIKNEIDQLSLVQNPTEEQSTMLESLKNDLAGIESYRKYSPAQEEAKSRLEAFERVKNTTLPQTQTKYIEDLANDRYALEQELTAIKDKIANRPDDVTDEDIIRFNKIREGVIRYDNVLLNLNAEKEGVNKLTNLADRLKTAQGRRDVLREQFGKRGDYTQGESSLDNLILSSNKQAVEDIINNASAQAQQSQEMLQEAFRQGRISKQELRMETEKLHDSFQKYVDDAKANLVYGDEDYRNNVNELNAIQSRIDSGEFTEEDMARAEQLKSTIDSYEGNTGLTGRARTGEGTYFRRVQDKIDSGQSLTAEDLKYLGFKEGDFMSLPHETQQMLRDIQIDPETFSIQDVATLDDIARASDLARLGGDEASNYLINELGIDESDYNAIVDRYTMGEGDTALTTTEELSPADNKAIEKVAAATRSSQKQIRSEMQDMVNTVKHAYEYLGKASQWPPHDDGSGKNGWQHYHYHYNIYKDIMNQARKKQRNFLSKYLNAPTINVEGISKQKLNKQVKEGLRQVTPKIPGTEPYGKFGQPVKKLSTLDKIGRAVGGAATGFLGWVAPEVKDFGKDLGQGTFSTITGQGPVVSGRRLTPDEEVIERQQDLDRSRAELGGVSFNDEGGVKYNDGGVDNRRKALKKLSNRNYLKYIEKG